MLFVLTNNDAPLYRLVGIDLSATYGESVNPAPFDEEGLHTCLANLVSNAIKFTRPRGKITVSAKSSRKVVQILVADNGIGIPEDLTGKLFRIDEQVTRTGTANEEGTGLGLILSMEFARKNNGTLTVTSKPGKGNQSTLFCGHSFLWSCA